MLYDDADESFVDAYHQGYGAFFDGSSLPYDDGPLADQWREGKRDAQRASRVRVVMPERAEGYYYTNPNGEDS